MDHAQPDDYSDIAECEAVLNPAWLTIRFSVPDTPDIATNRRHYPQPLGDMAVQLLTRPHIPLLHLLLLLNSKAAFGSVVYY